MGGQSVDIQAGGAQRASGQVRLFSGDYIRQMGGVEHRIGQMLLAVVINRSGVAGRQFRIPSEADVEAAAAAERDLGKFRPAWEIQDLVPNEPIFEGKETKRSVDMGLTRWSDMFAPPASCSPMSQLWMSCGS